MLHIVYSLNVGGLERVVVDLAKGFRKKGNIVSICCLDGKGALGEEAELAGIKLFSLGKKPNIVWHLPFRIAKIIREEHFDIVHTHNEAGLIYGATAALIARFANIVHTEHGKEPEYANKKALKIFERLIQKKVKQIVTVSEDLRNMIVKSSGINGDRVVVIQNGIDIENYFRPECRDEKRMSLGIGPEGFVIGNIARLVPLKNHRFLLTIFRELLKDFSNIKLILVGDGPLRENLEAYSRELGIFNSMVFLGERKDVPELLSAFDLFIMPSLTEGVSITILEAMAAGIPIVASEVGGNSEIIENEKTGFLIPLDETSKWIETIKSIIRGDNKRRNISEMSKRSVTERFSLKTMIENYEKIYKK